MGDRGGAAYRSGTRGAKHEVVVTIAAMLAAPCVAMNSAIHPTLVRTSSASMLFGTTTTS